MHERVIVLINDLNFKLSVVKSYTSTTQKVGWGGVGVFRGSTHPLSFCCTWHGKALVTVELPSNSNLVPFPLDLTPFIIRKLA